MRSYLFGLIIGSGFLAVILFFPFSLHPATRIINAGDPLFYAWNLSHNARSVTHGFKDLLDTNIFYPATNTLAFSDTLFAQTVITAPIIFLTHNPILTENLYIFLTFPLAAMSMFMLSYYITKHKAASFLSAVFFAFSYPRIAQISHLPTLSSQWLPLFVLFLIQFFDTGRSRYLVLCFLFFLFSLTSTVYYGVFASIFASCIVIAYGFVLGKLGRTFVLDRIKKVLILAVPVIIIIIIAAFPYIRFKAEHHGVKRTVDESYHQSSHIGDYITVLPTSIISKLGFPTDSNERALYPTFAVMLFSVVGILHKPKRRRRLKLLFLILALFSFFITLGPYQPLILGKHDFGYVYLPFFYLYKIFPLLQLTRVPARFSIFVILSLSVLASYGIAALNKFLPKKILFAVYVIIGALFLLEVFQANTSSVPVPIPPNIPSVYTWLETQKSDVVIAELPLTPMYWGESFGKQITKQYKDITLTDMLVSETYRVYFSSFHNKRMINGYSGYFPDEYYQAVDRLAPFPSEDSINLLKSRNVTFAIVHLWEYPAERQQIVLSALSANSQVRLAKIFQNDYVYEIMQ